MAKLRVLIITVVLVAVVHQPVARGAVAPEPFEDRQWNVERLEARPAWQLGVDGSGAVVAVIDTGVDVDHPEFPASKLVWPANCIDAAEHAECVRGSDAADDDHGHGTHVAGIVAAPLDGIGIAGVAPGARIMPVKVLDGEGTGTSRDVASGVRYAAAHGADVINLSLSQLPVVAQLSAMGVLDRDLARAIDDAGDQGVLVVVAAGNDSFPICSHKVFVTGEGICVGATDARNLKAPYSNFGSGTDVVAPGGWGTAGSWFPRPCRERVLSTHPTEGAGSCSDGRSGYAMRAGTSMAAPHVAGVGALLASSTPPITGPDAAHRIRATTVDLGALGYDPVYGYGLVNARRAVEGDTGFSWRPIGS